MSELKHTIYVGCPHICCASVPTLSDDAKNVTVAPCKEPVDAKHLMCEPHWRLVDPEIRRRIVKLQKRVANPPQSKEWRELAREAVLFTLKTQMRKLELDAKLALKARQEAESASDDQAQAEPEANRSTDAAEPTAG